MTTIQKESASCWYLTASHYSITTFTSMDSSVPLPAAHAVKVAHVANGILRLMTVAHMSPRSSSNS